MKLADRIILHLLKYGRRDPSEIMIPNFYDFGYEMDMFKLTRKQLVVEYEIKISRADYFNDFKKNVKPYKCDPIYKHQDIPAGKAANSFFFIVPAGLVEKTEVPHYAGLMYFIEDVLGDKIETIKPAPVLHKRPFTEYQQLAKSLSWREDRWRRKCYKTI